MYTFSATIEIIDINPYVEVPQDILQSLLKDAKKQSGPIPVKGKLNGKLYKQTVVKFRGLWRLYLNTPMREVTQTIVGDKVTVEIMYDAKPRTVPIPKAFAEMLYKHKQAKEAFEKLSPYRQKEILRYLGSLKSEEALQRNIQKTIQFLTGKKTQGVLFR
jgi:hypothetical protein